QELADLLHRQQLARRRHVGQAQPHLCQLLFHFAHANRLLKVKWNLVPWLSGRRTSPPPTGGVAQSWRASPTGAPWVDAPSARALSFSRRCLAQIMFSSRCFSMAARASAGERAAMAS